MGYFLLYEGMLDSVITARDKYLTPGGVILPNDCYMHLFAISDEERYFFKEISNRSSSFYKLNVGARSLSCHLLIKINNE